MIDKNIINAMKNNQNVSFFCDIKLNGQSFYFTNNFEKIKIQDKEYSPGIDDFYIEFERISQNDKNWIKIAAPEETIANFSFIHSGEIKIFAKTPLNDEKYTIFNGIILKIDIENKNVAKIYFASHLIKLSREFGDFFSKTCRAEFGDAFCKKNLSQYTFLSTIKSIINQYQIEIDLQKEDGTFTSGYAIFEKNDQNFKTKILLHANNIITILSLAPFEITQNLTTKLILPCNKTLSDCAKFNNIFNFRGEPFITEDG